MWCNTRGRSKIVLSHLRRFVGVGVGLLAVLGAVVLFNGGCGREAEVMTEAPTVDIAAKASFVGRESCIRCHENENRMWEGSHHDLAMQEATERTVLGDFDGTTFAYNGVTSTFFKKDDKFFVRTDGPDGELDDYEIDYTFGAVPLQQYLIEFPGGRYQALPICWDTRPAEDGGQRWFHLYPGRARSIGNRDYRCTGPAPSQNWNYMCSECHSTNRAQGLPTRRWTATTPPGPKSTSRARPVTVPALSMWPGATR